MLPKDSRSLLRTVRSTNSAIMSGGTYCHIGGEKCLMAACSAIRRENHPIPKEFILDFNIDGVSYSKSTKNSLTLIQMNIRDVDFDPFVVGVYCGREKPESNELMRNFVDDMNKVISVGFQYDDESIFVKPGNFCCDTPAVTAIRGSKGHAGFSCCVKCTQKGIRLDHCLVFPYITQSVRTDEDFRNRKDPDHHVKESILENIDGVDMVHSFPTDEMHIVLGVMKKLVADWIKNFTKEDLKAISIKIQIAEGHRPVEIHRQIRHLTEYTQFKAKEFRTLLMYTGPFLLKDVLDTRKYNHFLLLHTAIRKLCDVRHHIDIENTQNSIEDFVRQYKNIYGLNRLTYVVHNLIHFCEDVKLHGPPKNFSAYKFENNNNKLVQNIRHGKNVAQQIHNRAIEAMNVLHFTTKTSSSPELQAKYIDDVDRRTKFRKVLFKQLTIDGSPRNQWILTKNNKVCSFKYAEILVNTIRLTCEKCEPLESFYYHPLNSFELNTYVLKEPYDKVEFKIDIDLFSAKLYAMPIDEGMVFFPLLNE